MKLKLLSLSLIAISIFLMSKAQAEPDVLVLGDSQISFGAGEAYLDFFNQLPANCAMSGARTNLLKKLGQSRTAAIGVRSTSLHSWTSQSGNAKGTICDVDQKYGVNAGVYGIQGNNNRQYVQIGQGADYQFCGPNASAFENAFAPGNYKPKLLVLAFLGNSAERWANNPSAAKQDVQRTTAQIPRDIPCIFMTTAPVFSSKTNEMRMKAQDVIIEAFERSDGHCEVVEGFTTQTREAIEGQAQYFRRNNAGRVTDPLHPRPAATRLFLELNMPKLCNAVFNVLQ